jgi:uncharacterized membrane protein
MPRAQCQSAEEAVAWVQAIQEQVLEGLKELYTTKVGVGWGAPWAVIGWARPMQVGFALSDPMPSLILCKNNGFSNYYRMIFNTNLHFFFYFSILHVDKDHRA